MNKIALNYDDVYLIPNKCTLDSRSDADTSIQLNNVTFKLPVIPANMVSTINFDWARFLDTQGYLYIMHRFNNNTVNFVKDAVRSNFNVVSISTGVGPDSLKELEEIKEYSDYINFITIDVAHGHSDTVARRLSYIKRNFTKAYVIAGNVATSSGAKFLDENGADAVKVGIGSGVICTTKLQTGFHIPMFTCIQDCADSSLNCDIIADGGIKHYGDVAKAMVAGADMVMAGGIFACCSDSPAAVVGGKKIYFGSTSMTAKQKNDHIEGRTIDVEVQGTLSTKLHEITQALQSSISYAGGKDLKSLSRGNVFFKIKA